MTQDLDNLSATLIGPTGYGSASGTIDAACLVTTGAAELSPSLRKGGVALYAVRNLLRTAADSARILPLYRWTGIGLAMVAWMCMLYGLAHLVVAALHNRDGELGLGLDDTMLGAKSCLVSALIAAVGVPLWVYAERRIRQRAGATESTIAEESDIG